MWLRRRATLSISPGGRLEATVAARARATFPDRFGNQLVTGGFPRLQRKGCFPALSSIGAPRFELGTSSPPGLSSGESLHAGYTPIRLGCRDFPLRVADLRNGWDCRLHRHAIVTRSSRFRGVSIGPRCSSAKESSATGASIAWIAFMSASAAVASAFCFSLTMRECCAHTHDIRTGVGRRDRDGPTDPAAAASYHDGRALEPCAHARQSTRIFIVSGRLCNVSKRPGRAASGSTAVTRRSRESVPAARGVIAAS
jgi:hypothetical protein